MARNNTTAPILPKISTDNSIAKTNPAIIAQYKIRIRTAVCSNIPFQKPCLAIDAEREKRKITSKTKPNNPPVNSQIALWQVPPRVCAFTVIGMSAQKINGKHRFDFIAPPKVWLRGGL
jgi:hypothetical protein